MAKGKLTESTKVRTPAELAKALGLNPKTAPAYWRGRAAQEKIFRSKMPRTGELAGIIKEVLGFTNGFAVTDDRYEALCQKAASRIRSLVLRKAR